MKFLWHILPQPEKISPCMIYIYAQKNYRINIHENKMRSLVYIILLCQTSFLNQIVTSLDDDTDFFEHQTVNSTNNIIVKTIVVDQSGIV